jgi:arylsulfatase
VNACLNHCRRRIFAQLPICSRKDGASAAAFGASVPEQIAQAQPAPTPLTVRNPNILFIMGYDIGWFNISAHNMGIMGYRTPNIDRIGREDAVFTRAAPPAALLFITGQSPIHTGLKGWPAWRYPRPELR